MIEYFKQNNKTGIKNDGVVLIPAVFDRIRHFKDYLVVGRDKRIGVFRLDGTMLFDTLYTRIECVNISNKTQYRQDSFSNVLYPCCYSKKYIFDSIKENPDVIKSIIICNGYIKTIEENEFDFQKDLILCDGTQSHLFNTVDGFITTFDEIYPLTNVSFCVKKGDKYGVYRRDCNELIIPCKYDQIRYTGGHTVLLRQGDLWGAQDTYIDSESEKKENTVRIPIEYNDIEYVDEKECLFSVAKNNVMHDNQLEYFLIWKNGQLLTEFRGFDGYAGYDSHFKWYSASRILTMRRNKYGFINLRNQVTAPFIYDEVELRSDGRFNIRIGSAWGILRASGHEFPQVKYSTKFEDKFDYIIVTDARSKKEGIINSSGYEIIPCIYDHLMINKDFDLVYFGYGGYKHSDRNFFTDGITSAKWGCMHKNGQVFIPAKYDCYKLMYGHILAGRDGRFLAKGSDGFLAEYSGVYDLYDFNGKLIFKGFDFCEYDETEKIWSFKMNGHWEQVPFEEDEWGNTIRYYDYRYVDYGSHWEQLQITNTNSNEDIID